MNSYILKLRFSFRSLIEDSLLNNSVYILLCSLSGAIFGITFWILAAKLYSAEDIGLATALISSLMLIVQLSRLGLDQTLIKDFSSGSKSQKFHTITAFTTACALVLGSIYILGWKIWAPQLFILGEYPQLVLAYIIVCSLSTMTGITFVAFQRSKYYFFQSLIVGARVLLLPLFIGLNALGLFIAFGVSFIFASVYSLKKLFSFGLNVFDFDARYIRKSFQFSIANYVAGILTFAPTQMLPLIVLNVLGAEATGQFFIAFSIGSAFFNIPSSISTSLFVEGSYGHDLKSIFGKSFSFMLMLIVPSIILFYFLGPYIFEVLGEDYEEGFTLALIIAVSSILVGVFQFFISVMKIKKELRQIIVTNSIAFCLLLGSCYHLLTVVGTIGIGYAWILTYGVIDVILLLVYKGRVLTFNERSNGP